MELKTIGVFILIFVVFYGLFSGYIAENYNKKGERIFWSLLIALATIMIMP